MTRVEMVADAIAPLFELYKLEWRGVDAELRFKRVKQLKSDLGTSFSERLVVSDPIPPRADGVSELAVIAEFLALTALQYSEMEPGAYHEAFGRRWMA